MPIQQDQHGLRNKRWVGKTGTKCKCHQAVIQLLQWDTHAPTVPSIWENVLDVERWATTKRYAEARETTLCMSYR